MEKLYNMEHQAGKWIAAILGILGGMAKWIHLQIIGNTIAINNLIEPVMTAALCGFAGVLGKEMYKWIARYMKRTGWPWMKSLFTKKR